MWSLRQVQEAMRPNPWRFLVRTFHVQGMELLTLSSLLLRQVALDHLRGFHQATISTAFLYSDLNPTQQPVIELTPAFPLGANESFPFRPPFWNVMQRWNQVHGRCCSGFGKSINHFGIFLEGPNDVGVGTGKPSAVDDSGDDTCGIAPAMNKMVL